jgi:hypothetical protein
VNVPDPEKGKAGNPTNTNLPAFLRVRTAIQAVRLFVKEFHHGRKSTNSRLFYSSPAICSASRPAAAFSSSGSAFAHRKTAADG